MFRTSKPYFLLATVFSLLVFSARAQDSSRTINLDEAIQLGISNSKLLRLSKARLEEAVAASRESREKRLPDLNISGSYLRLTQADVNLKSNGGTDTGSAGAPNISQALYGMATVNLPIYSGGKIKYGIESAKFLEKAAAFDAASDQQEVVLNTVGAYLNLYKAIATVKLVEENLLQSRQRDTDLSNLEKNGLLARNDLLKAQLETSNYELSLLDAQNQVALANMNMNLLLGLSETTKIRIDSSSIVLPAAVQPLADYLAAADSQRNDVKALELRRKAAAEEIKTARADYYPGIALTGGYIAADIPKLLTVTNAFNIGVGLKYNLSSLWKTDAKIQQARARENQLLANEALLQDDIRLSINKAYQDFVSGKKKIDVYQRSVEQATENYRISKNKYSNNLLTLSDLLDADVAQLRARLNLQLASADLMLAYQNLLQKAGMIQFPNHQQPKQ